VTKQLKFVLQEIARPIARWLLINSRYITVGAKLNPYDPFGVLDNEWVNDEQTTTTQIRWTIDYLQSHKFDRSLK